MALPPRNGRPSRQPAIGNRALLEAEALFRAAKVSFDPQPVFHQPKSAETQCYERKANGFATAPSTTNRAEALDCSG